MKLCGIILAAGASRRMGQPKALLDYHGETFVDRLRRLFAAVCDQVVVVGSAESPFAADAVNPDPERGMLSSLQCGLIGLEADAVMFTPVDTPAISATTIETLANGWQGEALRIPRYGGKRGHPVLFSAALIPEFLAETQTPRDVVVRHEHEITYIDVDDPGILADADTPLEYERLIANG